MRLINQPECVYIYILKWNNKMRGIHTDKKYGEIDITWPENTYICKEIGKAIWIYCTILILSKNEVRWKPLAMYLPLSPTYTPVPERPKQNHVTWNKSRAAFVGLQCVKSWPHSPLHNTPPPFLVSIIWLNIKITFAATKKT